MLVLRFAIGAAAISNTALLWYGMLLVSSVASGFSVLLEARIQREQGVDVRLLFTVVVVCLASLSVVLLQRSPLEVAWIGALWHIAPALPIVVFDLLVIGLLALIRRSFYTILALVCRVDYVTLYYQQGLHTNLGIYWYSTRRHLENVCLLLLRFSVERSDKPRKRLGLRARSSLARIDQIILDSIASSPMVSAI